MDPEVHGNDREAPQGDENEIPNLPRIVAARRRRPVQPLWYWNRIYPGGLFKPRNIPFTGHERILKPLPRNPSTEDFFRLYITVDVIDMIVTQIFMLSNFLQGNSTYHHIPWPGCGSQQTEMRCYLSLE